MLQADGSASTWGERRVRSVDEVAMPDCSTGPELWIRDDLGPYIEKSSPPVLLAARIETYAKAAINFG